MIRIRVLAGLLLLLSLCKLPAQTEKEARLNELRALSQRMKYQEGKISLGDNLATLDLSDKFRYVDPAGTETLLTGIWGNPPSREKSLGMIVPAGFTPFDSQAWCVVIRYQNDGYVKDNDAEKINYTKLLKQMQESVREGSKQRLKDGYPSIELIGWATPPRYDQQTHKFYWAKELKFGDTPDEHTLNYNLRILGRRGILELNAVSGMSQFSQIEKATPDILAMVNFNSGNRYADYTPGTDKIATYGLAALVAGGIAAKAGFFKGLLVAILALKKFLIIGVIAVVAFLKKIFGRKSETAAGPDTTAEPPPPSYNESV
jgi:uncharacterized membrane-anchored protein